MINIRIFLIISSLLFIGLAALMGSSQFFLIQLLNIHILIEELQFFRILMGFYLVFGLLFLYGAISTPHTHIVLTMELIIVTGSIIGCCYSVLIDGQHHWAPSTLLLLNGILFAFCIYFLSTRYSKIR